MQDGITRDDLWQNEGRFSTGEVKDKNMKIRFAKLVDIPALQKVAEETELFPSEMLFRMVDPFLSGENEESQWLVCEVDESAIGFCYSAREQLTDGTWNMLAIAVLSSKQGVGVGAALASRLECVIRNVGARVLIADTSGTKKFERTREFYRKIGFAEEARIRDFWSEGDDKVTFWKKF